MHLLKGMSLVELLVAMAILAIAIIPILSLFSQAIKTSEYTSKRTIAINLARDLQEEIRSKVFAEPNLPALSNGAVYFPNGTTSFPFGCEECKTAPFVNGTDMRNTKFNDIDDYHGWCEGKDCNTPNAPCLGTSTTDGTCGNTLQAYNGETYTGAGYPRYQGFTRYVEVWHIWNNISTIIQPGDIRTSGWEAKRHTINLGRGSYRQSHPFDFFNLSDTALQSTAPGSPRTYIQPHTAYPIISAPGQRTRLKVIKVTILYTGLLTPNIKIDDLALIPMPINRESTN